MMAINTGQPSLRMTWADDELALDLAPLQGRWLVVEIMSPDNPERDTEAKRADYAEAGIPKYWIVDPEQETITVLRLEEGVYAEHGVFRRGDPATSASLREFSVSVAGVLDAR